VPTHTRTEPLLTPAEAADRLQVSIRTVRRLMASGKLKSLRIRRLRRIMPAALEAYVTEAAGE
jgi:excisionase family DNA binding protein